MRTLPWYVIDPFIFQKMFLERPLHTYNPLIFAGVLLGRPLVVSFAMMIPVSSFFYPSK